MLSKQTLLTLWVGLALALAACAPAAPPPPTSTKAPVAAPTSAPAAAATKAPEAVKPPAPAATQPPPPTPTPRPVTVKHGTISSAGDAGIFVAVEKGYFKEQGLTMELVPFAATAEMIPAVSAGQVDSITGPFSQGLLNALDRGIELKIATEVGMSQPNWEFGAIVLRKDLSDSGQVKTPKDLKGMKVANPTKGGMAEQSTGRMLEQGGLTMNDVEIVLLPQGDQAAAFANKGIAAGWILEPFITRVVQEKLAVKWIPLSQIFGGPVNSGIVTFGPTLVKDPDVARRWMVAKVKGVRDYLKAFTTGEGRAEVVNILTKHTSVKDPKLYEVMAMPYMDPNGWVNTRSLEDQYKWLVDMGLYTGKKTLKDILEPSFAEYAVQRLGKQ